MQVTVSSVSQDVRNGEISTSELLSHSFCTQGRESGLYFQTTECSDHKDLEVQLFHGWPVQDWTHSLGVICTGSSQLISGLSSCHCLCLWGHPWTVPSARARSWCPQYMKNVELSEQVQRRNMKFIKGLEHFHYEDSESWGCSA